MNSVLLMGVVFGVAVGGSAQAAAADTSNHAAVNFLPASGTALATPNRFDAGADTRARLFAGSYLAMNSVEDPGVVQDSGPDPINGSVTSKARQSGLNQLALATHTAVTLDATRQSEADAVSCSTGSHNCTSAWNGALPALAVKTMDVESPGDSVSMPSSVLLFGPGLLGLAVIARRRDDLSN